MSPKSMTSRMTCCLKAAKADIEEGTFGHARPNAFPRWNCNNWMLVSLMTQPLAGGPVFAKWVPGLLTFGKIFVLRTPAVKPWHTAPKPMDKLGNDTAAARLVENRRQQPKPVILMNP